MSAAQWIAASLGVVCLAIAAAYSVIALAAAVAWRRYAARPQALPAVQPPVTVLKPLCGSEPMLYEHLRSFCCQAYSRYQIVFGTLDAQDPALDIVRRLVAEFPQLSIATVVNPQRHGHNNKTSNLINMLAEAQHPILVIADSDTYVGPSYLAAVTAPLRDAGVGLVTCLSHDMPAPDVWSRLGAMYNNEWYFPSVMLAWLFGHQGYASGQTLCLRRSTLDEIGGLQAFMNHIADDYQLGHLIRERNLRIVLSPYEIQAEHHESSLSALTQHEIRWMGTLHILRPLSFRMIFLTFSLVMASIGMLLGPAFHWPVIAWFLFGSTLLCRTGLHIVYRRRYGRSMLTDLLLVPVREALTCYIWARSLFSKRMTWRGYEFDIDSTGLMRRIA